MDQEDNVTQRRIAKRLVLDVSYSVGRQDPANGVFEGGVPGPEHMDEFRIDAASDAVDSERTDELAERSRLELNVRGSRRAYRAFAGYLLALCELETQDSDYHDHFDEVRSTTGEPVIHMIVHRPVDRHS
ncbi:MAG TPA: hypothetical protein VFU72_13765, partial [Nitrolancea sp.]|nr:hypothetical protein [Nitrolancea sp.]